MIICLLMSFLYRYICVVFINDTATTEIYTYAHTLSLHDALPILLEESLGIGNSLGHRRGNIFLLIVSAVDLAAIEDHEAASKEAAATIGVRSEEHTSELQSLMRISYAVFCLKKKT